MNVENKNITAMDANKDAVEAVKRGGLTMTIALPPYDIGRMGVICGKMDIKNLRFFAKMDRLI